MWSASPLDTVTLSSPLDVWVDVPSTAVTFELMNEAVVLVSYDVSVSHIQSIDAASLTLDQSEVAFRVVLDDRPYRESGTTVGDNEPLVTVASGYLAVEIPAGSHHAQLQWRKHGTRTSMWIITGNELDGFAGGRSLVVSAQHRFMWFTQPLSNAALKSKNAWEQVPDMTLSLRLSEASALRIFYQIPVRPQTIQYSRGV
jgi:hypothetical protein